MTLKGSCHCGKTRFEFDPSKRRISVNLWSLDDFDIAAVPVEVIDGKNLW